MIDRHLVQQMDRALKNRARNGLETNEQALFAFIKWADNMREYDLVHPAYFLPRPRPVRGYLPSCWITPKGGVYTVDHCGHGDFANLLGVSGRLLERAGWVHVSDGRADDYYNKLSAGQRAVIAEYGFRRYDCSGYAATRLTDEAKDERLRGIEFRQRPNWDWRTEVVKDSGTMFAPLPGEAVEQAYRESCRDRAYQDDIAF